MRNIEPNMAKKIMVMAALAAVKRRFSKKRTSSMGWSVDSSQRTKAPSTTTPAPKLMNTLGSDQPLSGASMMPHSTANKPAIESTAPRGSSRGADGSRDSGSKY